MYDIFKESFTYVCVLLIYGYREGVDINFCAIFYINI